MATIKEMALEYERCIANTACETEAAYLAGAKAALELDAAWHDAEAAAMDKQAEVNSDDEALLTIAASVSAAHEVSAEHARNLIPQE